MPRSAQLALRADRDSDIVALDFDERDRGVKDKAIGLQADRTGRTRQAPSSGGRELSIRSALTVIVFVCAVPLALAAAALIAHIHEREREQLVGDVLDTARALAHAVDRDLATVQAAALVLAETPYLDSGDLTAFYGQAVRVVSEQKARNVVLTDRSGQQLVNTLLPFGAPLPRHGNLEQLRHTFETGRPSISNLFIGAVAGRPLVGIEVPVRRGDAVIYALAMGMFPENLSSVLIEQRLPAGWVGAIFDGAGTIVGRTRDPERWVGKQGAPALIQRMKEIDEGWVETNTLEGIPVVYVFSRAAVSSWTVAIGIPRPELAAQLRNSLFWLVLITVVPLTLGLGLAWTVGGRIVRSIQALIAPALALGNRRPIEVPPLRLKEADQVGSALTRASQMLQEGESRLHRLGDNLPNGAIYRMVMTPDGQRRIEHVSRGIERLTRLTPEELIADASRFYGMLDPHDQAALSAFREHSRVTGESIDVDVRLRLDDGTVRWANVRSAPERQADGSTLWDGVLTDVTERKRQTEELHRSHEALERSNLELQRFTYVASHDLQTPLRSVCGFAQLLQSNYSSRLDEQANDWIQRIVRSGERMAMLVRDLVAYSRVELQSRPFKRVGFREILEDAIFLLDAAVRDSGAQITYDELPVVTGDRAQLVQLMQNLVGNAIKYRSDAPPRVHVSAKPGEKEWVFSIRDNGIGIEPRYQEQIFEIFQRLHDQRQIPGTGIGLAVCRRIIHHHGGRLWVESQPGGGSTFLFTIPRLD